MEQLQCTNTAGPLVSVCLMKKQLVWAACKAARGFN